MKRKTYNKQKYFLKYFILSFVSFILIVSLLFILITFIKITVSGRNNADVQSTTDLPNYTDLCDVNIEGERNILFVCKENDLFLFSFTVNTNYNNKEVLIKCYNSKYHRNIDSVQKLKSKIESEENLHINKYLIIDKQNIYSFLSMFNGFTVNIPYDLDVNCNNIKINLYKGENRISAEYIVRMLEYNNEVIIKCVVKSIVSEVLCSQYFDFCDENFKTLVNLSTTDISVIDYSENIDKIKAISNCKNIFKFEVR